MDAARVLHKKKAMHGEQVETEIDLLDSRMKEQVTFYGYQDWDIVADVLARRRAKYCFRIPHRGRVEGYSRKSMDERYENGEWPEPDLVDTFPDLSGTDIWEEFKQRDRAHKEARMRSDEEEAENTWAPKEVVEDVLANSPAEYVKINPYNPNSINKELLQLDYNLSARASKTVAEGLKREIDLDQFGDSGTGEAGGEGEGAHT